jgi:hypothetical protein
MSDFTFTPSTGFIAFVPVRRLGYPLHIDSHGGSIGCICWTNSNTCQPGWWGLLGWIQLGEKFGWSHFRFTRNHARYKVTILDPSVPFPGDDNE